MARLIALLQGAYLLITGAWALVSINSFMTVTGQKTDAWLVKTVAALLIVIGAVLLSSLIRHRVVREAALLGAGCAFALGFVDTFYSLTGTISLVYLLDAVIEIAVIALWVVAWRRGGLG